LARAFARADFEFSPATAEGAFAHRAGQIGEGCGQRETDEVVVTDPRAEKVNAPEGAIRSSKDKILVAIFVTRQSETTITKPRANVRDTIVLLVDE